MEKQVEKNFVWVIKDLTFSWPKKCQSDPFLIAGSRWRLLALPNGTNFEFFYQYLGVADYQSLTSTWRRHVKLRLTIVHGMSEKRSIVTDSDLYFDEKSPCYLYPTVPPPSKLLQRGAGFLVSGALTIVIEVVALEVIGTSAESNHLRNKTQELHESIDVYGFHVLPSQVESVRRIFEKYPDFALNFRPKSRHLKSTYMNVLLGLIKTICQPPQEQSDDDLNEAWFAVSYLANGGFKVDWLENKLKEVKAKKKKVDTGNARLQQMVQELQKYNQKCLDLKTLMEKENADLAANIPFSFNDVV